MAIVNQLVQLTAEPGVKDDIQPILSDTYLSTEWVRFRNTGMPQKILGMESIADSFTREGSAIENYGINGSTCIFSYPVTMIEKDKLDPTKEKKYYLTSIIYAVPAISFVTQNRKNILAFKQLFFDENGALFSGEKLKDTPPQNYNFYYLPDDIDYDSVIPTLQVVNFLRKGGDGEPAQVSETYLVLSLNNASELGSSETYKLYYAPLESKFVVSDASIIAPIPIEFKICETDQTTGNPPVKVPLTYSGGCLVLNNTFMIVYGNGGIIWWKVPKTSYDNVADFFNGWNTDNRDIIDSTKVVAAQAIRGSTSYSCLFWSLGSLKQTTFSVKKIENPPDPNEDYTVEATTQTLATSTSILSWQSIVENNGIYYWLGEGQIYSYSGALNTIPNIYNGETFFNDMDRSRTVRILGFYLRKYNEIWWVYTPRTGTNTKINSKVNIFNLSLNCFNLTPTILPIHAFDGTDNLSFDYPLISTPEVRGSIFWTDFSITIPTLWQFEKGRDLTLYPYSVNPNFNPQPSGTVSLPIPCSLKTRWINFNTSTDGWSKLYKIEPLFLLDPQNVTYNLIVRTKNWANQYEENEPIIFEGLTGRNNYIDCGPIHSRFFSFEIFFPIRSNVNVNAYINSKSFFNGCTLNLYFGEGAGLNTGDELNKRIPSENAF